MISHKYSIVARCAFVFVFVGMFAIVGAAVGQDRVMLVDFGLDVQKTTATGWNNFFGIGGAKPTPTLNLLNSAGVATGINMASTWSALNYATGISGAAANYDGPYPSFPLWVPATPQSALRDGVYVRDGESLTLTLNNLPAGKVFSFAFYSAAGNAGDYSLFTVTGANSVQAHIAPLVNNSTTVAQINGIAPSAGQTISIKFEGRLPDGSPQNPAVADDGLGRFNFLGIAQFSPVIGDYNADQTANAADYSVWRANYGSTSNAAADGNFDGIVDAADYVTWRNATTVGAGPGLGTDVSAVPEPHTAALAVMALMSLCSVYGPASRKR